MMMTMLVARGAGLPDAGCRCRGRILRRIWLSSLVLLVVAVEVHQHVACNLSPAGDIDHTPPPQCRTVMVVHEYTELICKAGLVVVLLRSLISCRCRRETGGCALIPSGTPAVAYAPAFVYVLWPGSFWIVSGETGLCGPICIGAEAIMEHGCCLVVLLALAAAIWDIIAAYCVGGVQAIRKYFRNLLLFRHDIEDHLAPNHNFATCGSRSGEGNDIQIGGDDIRWQMISACCLWAAYFTTAGVYIANTFWGFLDVPVLGYAFRFLDTACHTGICAMVGALVVRFISHCSRDNQVTLQTGARELHQQRRPLIIEGVT